MCAAIGALKSFVTDSLVMDLALRFVMYITPRKGDAERSGLDILNAVVRISRSL